MSDECHSPSAMAEEENAHDEAAVGLLAKKCHGVSPMGRIKKRSFTLVETLLAFSLIAIVVGTLTLHFVKTSRLKARIEQTAHEILKRKLVQERLTQIFGSIYLEGEEKPHFICKNNQLELIINNGFDHDEALRGAVAATLYLKNHCLMLKLKKDKAEREENLYSGVRALEWEFMNRQAEVLLKASWDKDEPLLPLAIRLNLKTHDEQTDQFAFFPNILPPVIHCDK
ncbi:MAG: hypothetical protein KDK50_03680 [Chlamydiia bacterium]|nr:hypothetical protein [Chlamydiia bacterium]